MEAASKCSYESCIDDAKDDPIVPRISLNRIRLAFAEVQLTAVNNVRKSGARESIIGLNVLLDASIIYMIYFSPSLRGKLNTLYVNSLLLKCALS